MSELERHSGCERRLEELYSYLDEELSAEEATAVRQHVADCDPCAAEQKLEEIVRELLRRSCESRAPEELRIRIVERISITSTSRTTRARRR